MSDRLYAPTVKSIGLTKWRW